MKNISPRVALTASLIAMSALALPAYSAVSFTDPFQGTSIDPAHWDIKGQNATGWATVTENYLEINGGPVSPNNDSQGRFLQGKDGWNASEAHTVSLTLLPPNVTNYSSPGVQSLVSWLWISDGRPTSSSMTLSTNFAFLVKVYQGIGSADYNKVEVYGKKTASTGEGTLLWSGRYSLTDDPSLTITIGIDNLTYDVSFDQEMYSTTGSLSGNHGITFTNPLYANLGGSNGGAGRGETRFIDFSIAQPIPEPATTAVLLVGGAVMAQALRRHRRRA